MWKALAPLTGGSVSSQTVLSSPVAVDGHAGRAWPLCAGNGLCFDEGTLASRQ